MLQVHLVRVRVRLRVRLSVSPNPNPNPNPSEGVAPGAGTAELCILSGANHMAFCSPVDPCCAAARTDRPLKLPPGTDDQALVCGVRHTRTRGKDGGTG